MPFDSARPSITTAFECARQEQADLHKRSLTTFDQSVGNVVLQATQLAMEDVREGRRDRTFRVVSAPTGSGKTCGAAAAIAAGFKTDPDFSCAYITDTIRQAEATTSLIAELIGEDNVACWTSGHDENRDEAVMKVRGEYVPARMTARRALRTSRIVVVTHRLWQEEMKSGRDKGVRNLQGRRRSVVFVDEHPELVRLIERTPADIAKLRDRVLQSDPEHPWLDVLEGVNKRANAAFDTKGQTYVPVELIARIAGRQFENIAAHELLQFADRGIKNHIRDHQANDMELTCRFLAAASRGCVFLCRRGPHLVAYETEFEPGPGHVLLDATADITGMATLMPGMEQLDVPPVDFSPLKVCHIEQPGRFKRVTDVVKRAATARPYAEWIERTVLDNSDPGDDVLLVVHKALLDHDYVERAEDPNAPLDWNDRKVNTLHWGIGIGSNQYAHCRAVFLFSEFHVPRRKVVADVQGWTGSPPTEQDLKEASTRETSGPYLTALEGHLLRWTKQLACRGSVRQIDGDARCGAMTLYTSMDRSRLLRSMPLLFPGADAPTLLGGGKTEGYDGLARLLATYEEPILWSDDVEVATRIRSCDLSRAFSSRQVREAAWAYGWQLVSAKDIGEAGKRKVIVKSEHLAKAA